MNLRAGFLIGLSAFVLASCGGGQSADEREVTSQVSSEMTDPNGPATQATTARVESANTISPDSTLSQSPPPASTSATSVVTAREPAPRSAPSNVDAGASAKVLVLDGRGVSDWTTPNCPARVDDFMDEQRPQAVRLVPRHCRIVQDDPPVFSWPQPDNRDKSVAWTLEVKNASGTVTVLRPDVPRVHLQSPIGPGQHQWRVSYVARGGAVIHGEWRAFAIQPGLTPTPFPDGAPLAGSVQHKAHPRVLPAGFAFTDITSRARQSAEYEPFFRRFLLDAENLLPVIEKTSTAAPVEHTPADFKGNTLLQYQYLNALLQQSTNDLRNIQTLAYAWRFTGDRRFSDAALKRLTTLASWSPTGATGEASQDQANRNVYLALAIGLDLLDPLLSTTQRQRFGEVVQTRLEPVIAKFSQLDGLPYDSHLATSVGVALQTLLRTAGAPGLPSGNAWLAQTWNLYLALMPAWGEEDGSDGNGTTYGAYNLSVAALVAADVFLMTGHDFSRRAWLRNAGDFIYATIAPDGRQAGAFGDEMETRVFDTYVIADKYRLLANLTRSPQQQWYWRTRADNLQPGVPLEPAHFMLLGLRASQPAPLPATRQNWVFEDAGIAAFHTDVASPDRSSLFFRSSRFGAYNHSHADQNSVVLTSRGTNLLVNGGYYPYFGSPHHLQIGRATRYKNALTFDGGKGQAEPDARAAAPGAPSFNMYTQGRLINQFDNDRMALATGDATQAYLSIDKSINRWVPLLTAAHRTVVYLRKERIALWYDYAESSVARKWEWNYHTPGGFNADGARATVINGSASACMSIHGPDVTASVRTSFEIAPEIARPPQAHLVWTARGASKAVASVTVVREDCREAPIAVRVDGSSVTVSVAQETIVFDKKRVEVQNP